MRTSPCLSVAAVIAVAACSSDAARTTAPPLPAIPDAPAIRLVVIDSTTLPFAGTATERAAGHYVFRILGSVPTIGPGDYVAGKQGGLFLGRVVSVSQTGDRLTLEMTPAAWSEVFQSFKVHIPFTPGAGSAPSPYGEVRWGPWQLVTQPGQHPQAVASLRTAAGALADPVDFDPRDFFLDNLDLCVASGLVSGCGNIEIKLVAAHFSLTGGVDVGADIDIPHLSLGAHANIDERLATDATFRLIGHGAISIDVPIPEAGFVRKFSVGGVSGEIEVGLIVGVELNITGTTIEPHIAFADTIATGASVSTSSGFSFQYTGAAHFDAGAKVIDLGDLGQKVSIGPKVKVKFNIGDGGFALGAGADAFVEAKENLAGLLGFENWHVHVDVGTEAELEGSVKVPLIGVDLGGKETFPGPGINLVDLWGTGDLQLTTSTTGTDVLPSQTYTTSIARSDPTEPPPWTDVLSAALGANESHLFTGGVLCHQFFEGAPLIPPFIENPQDCSLVATAHLVSLTGLAANCSPGQVLPALVQVKPRNPFDAAARLTSLTLSVACRSIYAVARDRVAALLAAGAIDPAGIANALSAHLTIAEARRDAGDAPGARDAVFAFAHLVSAQRGKHITPAAADELRDLAALLAQCYVTIVPTCSAVPVTALSMERAQM